VCTHMPGSNPKGLYRHQAAQVLREEKRGRGGEGGRRTGGRGGVYIWSPRLWRGGKGVVVVVVVGTTITLLGL